jgi:hypothetical protein
LPGYRLYRMNLHSGHIEGVEEFHSGDDVEAILLVQGRPRRTPAELWCGPRKILRFDAQPETGRSGRPLTRPKLAATA